MNSTPPVPVELAKYEMNPGDKPESELLVQVASWRIASPLSSTYKSVAPPSLVTYTLPLMLPNEPRVGAARLPITTWSKPPSPSMVKCDDVASTATVSLPVPLSIRLPYSIGPGSLTVKPLPPPPPRTYKAVTPPVAVA